MTKNTRDEIEVHFENGAKRYVAVDVPLGSDCRGCDLRSSFLRIEERVVACDWNACTPSCRTDGRNVVFKWRVR